MKTHTGITMLVMLIMLSVLLSACAAPSSAAEPATEDGRIAELQGQVAELSDKVNSLEKEISDLKGLKEDISGVEALCSEIKTSVDEIRGSSVTFKKYVVATNSLNVRSSPSCFGGDNVIMHATEGEEINALTELEAEDIEWVMAIYKNQVVYVMKRYLAEP